MRNLNIILPCECFHIVHRLALDDGAVRPGHAGMRHARRHERVLVHEAHGAQVCGWGVIPIRQERRLLHASHFWNRMPLLESDKFEIL